MQRTIPKFERVAEECSEMMLNLDPHDQTFFNDNLRIYSYYMTHLSKALYHYVYAYKYQYHGEVFVDHLNLSYKEATLAQNYLLEGQHGVFDTWYTNADPLKRTFQIDSLKSNILIIKGKAK